MKFPITNSRNLLFQVLISIFIQCLALPANSTTFDYSTIWARLANPEVSPVNSEYGGLVDLVLKGNLAYGVDDSYGLHIIDGTNPTDPVFHGFLSSYPMDPRRCDAWDHYVYVIGNTNQLQIIDVDDSYNPELVNQMDLGDTPLDLIMVNGFLYISFSNGSLQVYNLASAVNPILVHTMSLPTDHAERLSLDGANLVTAGDDGLLVINAAVPTWPSIIGSYELSGNTLDLAVRSGLAIVGQYNQSRLINYSDVANIIEASVYEDTGQGVLITSNHQLWLGWEACASSGGMRIYDISNPAVPVWLHDEIDGFMGGPRTMVERQGLVYATEHFGWCAGEWAGFHVFQMGDLPIPEPLASLDDINSWGLLGRGQLADLATTAGFLTLDLSSPSNPEVIQTLDPEHGYFLPVEDDGLIVAVRLATGHPYTLQVLTRDDDGNLELRGEAVLGFTPTSLALSGSLALISFYNNHGVWAFDMANPDSPVLLAQLFDEEDVVGLALHGELAAVTFSNTTGLYDLSDLTNPTLLSSFASGGLPALPYNSFVEQQDRLLLLASIYESGGYLYKGGLAQVIDVTEPSSPEILISLRQLVWDRLGPVSIQGDLIVVPCVDHMSFYSWPDQDGQAEFLGRTLIPGPSQYYSPTMALILNNSIVNMRRNGPVSIWPLPTGALSGVAEDSPMPMAGSLVVTAHPNPFNPSCEIQFSMPEDGSVSVQIFDIQGRLVSTLLKANAYAGLHVVRWNGQDIDGHTTAAGVYLARVTVGGQSTSVKITLAK